MPFNGSGTYVPPAPPVFPADPLVPIPLADYNTTILDIADALSDCLTRDGQAGMTADLDHGGYRGTNMAWPVDPTDAASKDYVDNVSAGLVDAAMAPFGIVPLLPCDPLDDAAFAINAALQDCASGIVVLPAGTFGIASSIVLETGKTLRGAGAGLTRIVALDSFDDTVSTNGLIYMPPDVTDVAVHDLAVDGAKIRASGDTVRLTGFQMRGQRFVVERTSSSNCTGYGHFAQGDPGGFFFASGTFRDCWSYNCQINFEQTASDGVLLENCHARDGDGDLIGTYFHPLTQSRNITYIACSGTGNAFAGIELIADASGPMDNIRIIGCTIQMLGAVPALVQSGVSQVTNLQLLASSFSCVGGSGAVDMSRVEGSAVQCIFDGGAIGSDWTESVMSFTNCKSIGRVDPSGSASAYGINVTDGSSLRWSGGSLEAYGPANGRFWTSVSSDSRFIKTNDTRLVPAGPNASFSAANLVLTANRTGLDLSAGPPLNWDTAAFDTDGYFNSATPSRLTIPRGIKRAIINANVTVQDLVTTATIQMSLVRNGNKPLSTSVSSNVLAQGMSYGSGVIDVTAGDYYEVWVGVSGDTAVNIPSLRCNFSIQAVDFT